jgi:hypothetical protein
MNRLNRTDFEILEVLASGKRNIAANVALEIDADRSYVNNRFRYILEEGLVERVGPKKLSGLYEITPKGQAVVQYQDKYQNNTVEEFEAFVEQQTPDHAEHV